VTSGVSIPLSNLRAVVIVIVVAFHSALPYLASQPAHPFAFDQPPYHWIAFPIIDSERWFGFDLFCAWQDVSLMSLMFFLAGLLTPASLNRKGSLVYVSQRWWRIGLPFLGAVGILSPLAYFASYRATAADPTFLAFWAHWRALPMWPSGPQWFLWQLFLLSLLAAAIHAFARDRLAGLYQLAGRCSDRPLTFFFGLTALSCLAYVPLAMAFTPWEWASLGPFSFQLSRPLHYVLYFFAGFAVGGYDCDRGVLRCDGPIARNWRAWLATAIICFAAWGGLTSFTMPDWNASPLTDRLTASLAFPIACASGVLCLLAIALQLMRQRNRVLDSLSANAYGIYLVHYVFVLWLQYALLAHDLSAILKVAIVLPLALAMSWATCAGVKAVAPHLVLPGRHAMVDRPR
jgi:glucans biosynthesis protein C